MEIIISPRDHLHLHVIVPHLSSLPDPESVDTTVVTCQIIFNERKSVTNGALSGNNTHNPPQKSA